MGIEIEGAVDGGMAGKEAVSRFLRLELPQPSLALPDREMSLFSAVVLRVPSRRERADSRQSSQDSAESSSNVT